MKCVITGGAGFIGSHLADYLIAQGKEVWCIDNLISGKRKNIDHLDKFGKFRFTKGNVEEEQHVQKAISWCDTVFHLAAVVGVKKSLEHPLDCLQTNISSTAQVLKQASRYGKKVVLASSSEVYGQPEIRDGLPAFREDQKLAISVETKGRWAYASSKIHTEQLALAHFEEQKTPVIIVRFFNVVGARQNGELGMVLPSFVQMALAGKPLQIFGNGKQQRCFSDVKQTVEALDRLVKTPEAVGQVINIGGSVPVSIAELAERVIAVTGSTSEIQMLEYGEVFPQNFTDILIRIPDTEKMKKIIGMEICTNLDQVIRESAEWLKNKI